MLSKLKYLDMIKLQIDKIEYELEITKDPKYRVTLLKERGESIRSLKEIITD